jgi:D-serine deaminase-like pyridoxal phosphate-dependent protein
VVLDFTTLPTPRVVVDLPRVRRNIARMAALAAGAGVRLRPHAKTHKSPVIARWQIEAGAVGICCAKIGEAEVFADAGLTDIRLPYPVHPSNADRVIALVDRIHLSIIVDDLGIARGWSEAMTRAGRSLDVLVKVDVGFHRCGVNPDDPHVLDAIRQIAGLPGLRFRGLLSHAGQGYAASSEEMLSAVARHEADILARLTDGLRASDVHVEEVSVGATPTSRFIGDQPGVTEMRPGNYVFFDRTQVGLGAASLDDCALHIISTVVSRPARDRVIFDAGSKTLTSDAARGFSPTTGYGLVFPSLTATQPEESIEIERLSEEHATVRVHESCTLKPGDRVRILPNHSCVVTNLMDEVLLVDGDRVVDTLPIAARGRVS